MVPKMEPIGNHSIKIQIGTLLLSFVVVVMVVGWEARPLSQAQRILVQAEVLFKNHSPWMPIHKDGRGMPLNTTYSWRRWRWDSFLVN